MHWGGETFVAVQLALAPIRYSQGSHNGGTHDHYYGYPVQRILL